MLNRRTLIVACAALVAWGGAPLVAHAQTVLRAADVHPAGYPNVVAIENMGKKLEAATNGRYKIQMFPGGVLGSEKEMVEQTQVGAIQIARISLGVIGPVVPDVNVFNMPFVFRDEAHMRKVIDGPIGEELMKKHHRPARPRTWSALCWMNAGTRNVYNAKKADHASSPTSRV